MKDQGDVSFDSKKKRKAPDFIPIDNETIDRFGNVKNFYDLSDRSVASLLSIERLDNGYKVSSPFLKTSSIDRVNQLLGGYEIPNYDQEIKEITRGLSNVPSDVSFYNRTRKGYYTDIVDNYLKAQNKIANTPMEEHMVTLHKLKSKREMYVNGLNGVNNQMLFPATDVAIGETKASYFEKAIASIDNEINSLNGKITRVSESKSKARGIVTAFENNTVTEDMIPEIKSHIERTLENRLSRTNQEMSTLSNVKASIVDIVGSVRNELEFTSFDTEGEFYTALKSLNLEKEAEAVIGGFYGPSRGDDGYISVSKKPYLANQTVVVNNHAAPSKRFTLGGIDNISGFDVTNDNVERYLEPIGSDAVYDAAHASSGVITYNEAKTIEAMLDEYANTRASADSKETAYIQQKIKEQVESEAPTKAPIDYEENKRLREKLKTPGNKVHKDAVIDSVTNLSDEVKDRLKIRNVASRVAPSLRPDDVSNIPKSTPLDLQMIEDIYYKRDGIDPNVKGKLGTFISSVKQVDAYNEAIEKGNYAMLTSIDKSPMYEMPYGTQEEIEKLTETARNYASDRVNRDAKNLSSSLKGLDFSNYWREIEAIREEKNLSSDDYIIQNGFLDAGSHPNTSNGTEELHTNMMKESLKREREIEQFLRTERIIQDSDVSGITITRQRDTELVTRGLTEGSKKYDLRSIHQDVAGAPGITRSHLEQGYVLNDKGQKVSLQAYDEFNELLNLSDVRGKVDFNGAELTFTPGEWLDGNIKFGENSYSIRKFSEYYDPNTRKQMSDYLLSLPDYPGVKGRQNVEEELNRQLKDFVTNTKQPVEYTSRRTKIAENGEKVKYKTPTYVNVPLFTDEKIPSQSKRTIKGLKAIEPISAEDINIRNYEETFRKYGVDPSNTTVGRAINTYKAYVNQDASLLSEKDYAHLDKVMDHRRLRLNAEKDDVKRSVVLDRPVEDAVQNTIDHAVESKRQVQLDGDILHYKVLGQTPSHVTLESDYMLLEDLTVDVQYNGKLKLSELMSSLSELESAASVTGQDAEAKNKAIIKNVTVENSDDVIVSSNGKNVNAVKRSDIYNRIMGKNETVYSEYIDTKGKLKTKEMVFNKTAHDVMARNWSWMLDDEESIGIGYLGVYDAINELNETDMLEAAERLNNERRSKNLDLIDITNSSPENRESIMQVIDSAVEQKSKGKIISAGMAEKSNSIDPSVRVALKTLDAKGVNYSVDAVKDELMIIRDALNGPEYSFLYNNVDEMLHNDNYILEQISGNQSFDVSFEQISAIEARLSEFVDSYTDKVIPDSEVDFDIKGDSKLYNDFVESVTERLGIPKSRTSNIDLFNRVVQTELDKEIVASTEGLAPKIIEESLIGNYLGHNFYEKSQNFRKLPKKYQKELKKINGNWETIKNNNQTEWTNAENKLRSKLSSATFKDRKEATTVIGKVYDEISKGIVDDTIKESLLTNRQANVEKILEASVIKTDKGRTAYKLSKAYTSINRTILDDIKPMLRTSAIKGLDNGVLSTRDKATRGLTAVYQRNGNIGAVSDVLKQIGGSVAGGLEVLYGDDPNNVLKGLVVSGRDMQYNKGIAIDSQEGLAALQMLEKLTGGELSIVGRGRTGDGNYTTVHFDKFDTKIGIISDTVVSASGKPYKLIENPDQAKRTISKNMLGREDIRLTKESPVIDQLSKPLESTGLVASSLLDYDFVTGKTGSYGLSDPITSISNLKDAVSTNGKKITVFDFETSGLLGKIDNSMFAPVEFGYLEAFSKNGKILGNSSKSIYARPNRAIVEKILGGGMDYNADEVYTKTVNEVMSGLSDNSSTYNLFKNYAKYDKASGDFYMKDFKLENVIGQGGAIEEMVSIDGKTMKKIDYVEGLIDSARSVVEFMTTPGAKNTTKMNGEIMDFEPFIKTVRQVLGESDYIMGHNSNSADIRWLDFWSKSASIGESESLSLKNIDTFETYKLAMPGKSSYRLDGYIAKNMEGSAHLGDVDVKGTLLLANELSDNDSIKMVFKELDNPLEEGDYFVKTKLGNLGVEGLGKGVYQFNGVKKINRTKLGSSKKELTSHTQQVLVLKNMLSGNDVTVPFDNIASLRRDAVQNWSLFGTLEDAKSFHSQREQIDTNRTMKRAFNIKAWNNYESKGNGLQKDVITVLTGLRKKLNSGLIDQETMRVAEGVYRSGDIDDLGLLALSNIDKLDGKGYFKELSKTKDFSQDRIGEYLNFAEYAKSDEGKLVKEFLYEGDLRRRTYNRSGKGNIVSDYENKLYDIVKDVRSNVSGLTNEIPNEKILSPVTQEMLDELGGQKYGMTGIDPFNINVNTTNRSTIRDSLWNSVDDFSERILESGVVKSKSVSKSVALNEFVMPILSKALNNTEVMDASLQETIDALRNNSLIGETGKRIDVDENLSRTLDILIERVAHASKNKTEFISNLETVKEVDMHTVIPNTHEAHEAIISTMKERFAVALSELDDDLATVSYSSNGEIVEAVDENVKFVQRELVKIKKANDSRYKQVIQDEFGVENADAVLSHLNLNMKNSAGRKAHKNIAKLEEVHYNATSPDLSFKSAKEIVEEINSLYTDVKLPTVSELTGLLTELSAKTDRFDEITAKNPEFFDYLRKAFNGFYTKPSNVKAMNEKVKKATEKYVDGYNRDGLRALQKKKNDYFQELSDRAALPDIRNGKVVGEISDSVYDSHLTKYRAMEELGLIQTHDGKRYTGNIGLMGSFKEGVELDPSKVIVASSPVIKIPNVKTTPIGGMAGYALTDLTYEQLTELRDSQYTKRSYKPVVASYVTALETQLGQGDDRNKLIKNYNNKASLRYEEKRKALGDAQFDLNAKSFSEGEASPVALLNKSIKENTAEATSSVKAEASSKAQEVLEEFEPSILDNKHYRQFVETAGDVKNKAFGTLKELFGSKIVRYSAVAASAAVALALTKQYTSDGGTTDEKQQRDSKGRPIDDNYQREYNGVDRSKIRIPKTARVEENGKGLTIRASAKNRNYVTEGAIDDAVSSSLNDTIGASVNIRYQDDRESINQEYVQGLFSNALR